MYHEYECVLLLEPLQGSTCLDRLALRAVSRQLRDQKSKTPSVSFYFEYRRTYDDLLHHADKFQPERLKRRVVMSDKLSSHLAEHGHDVPSELILRAMQKCMINAHCVKDEDYVLHEARLGNALYLGASKSNHSCEFKSNYIEMMKGNRFIYKALADFSVSDSTQLNSYYVSPKFSYLRRQGELQQRWYFKCECERCLDEGRRPSRIGNALFEAVFDRIGETGRSLDFLRHFESKFAPFPNTHPSKNALLTRLFYSETLKQASLERVYDLATSALEGSKEIFGRMKLLFLCCLYFTSHGANQPDHEYFLEFQDLVDQALELFLAVHGKDHKPTQRLLALKKGEKHSSPLLLPAPLNQVGNVATKA